MGIRVEDVLAEHLRRLVRELEPVDGKGVVGGRVDAHKDVELPGGAAVRRRAQDLVGNSKSVVKGVDGVAERVVVGDDCVDPGGREGVGGTVGAQRAYEEAVPVGEEVASALHAPAAVGDAG